jgi:hypothetical protein
MTAMKDFIARRLTIPACKKTSVGTDGVKWFSFVHNGHWPVCEACHEDLVLGSPFTDHIAPLTEEHGATVRWTCTLSFEYIARALAVLSARADRAAAWQELLAAVDRRARLPECEGREVQATRCNWYRPARGEAANLDFCEACFLDKLGMTPLGARFAETGEDFMEKLRMRFCDMQLINVRECIHVCRTKGLGGEALMKALAKIAASPRCFRNLGIDNGKFYNFAGGAAANFGICEGCFAGIVAPHDVDAFFATQPKLVEGSAWCAFNPSVTRFDGLISHWAEATETGVWSAYETWVRKYASLPVCPNFNLAAKRNWHGWHDLPICQECFETVAEGTSLAPTMELRDAQIEEERLCALYSDRMRAKYKEACEAGDAAGLRAYNKHRMETYYRTVPRCKMLAEQQKMQAMLGMSQMMLSMSYQHANAMSDWVSPSKYEYGNSSVGYHSSQYGVESAKAWDEGQATLARANGPLAEAEYLSGIWKAVE